jgi:hypothetical protein
LIKHNDIFKHHNQKQFICYHFSWIHTATRRCFPLQPRCRLHIYFCVVSVASLLFFPCYHGKFDGHKNSCSVQFFAMTFRFTVCTLLLTLDGRESDKQRFGGRYRAWESRENYSRSRSASEKCRRISWKTANDDLC